MESGNQSSILTKEWGKVGEEEGDFGKWGQ